MKNTKVPLLALISEINGPKELLEKKFSSSFKLATPASNEEAEVIKFLEADPPAILLLALKKAKSTSALKKIKEHARLKEIPMLFVGEEDVASSDRESTDSTLALLNEVQDFFISSPLKIIEMTMALNKMIHLHNLNQSYENLEKKEMDLSKWTFLGKTLSGFIHDLNNSLTIVGLNLSLVNMLFGKKEWKEEYQEKGKKFGLEVEKGLDQVNATLTNIRGFINADLQTEGNPERMPVTIKEILEEGLKMCMPEIKKKRAELKINLPQEVETHSLLLDKNKFIEVMMYLLLNSIDPFKRPEEGQENLLKIEGSFLADGKSEVFQLCLMSNAQESPNENSQDLSIGLNLVRKIIENHNGRIFRANNANGVGSQWVIQLPKSV